MTLDPLTTVGSLVAARPSRSRAFEQFGIDYCCGGSRTIDQACREAGIATETLASAIARIDEGPADEGPDWTRESLVALCEHLVDTHHVFLRTEMPRVAALAAKVAEVHGPNHPELVDVRDLFDAFVMEMEEHLLKEERILFPMIRQLEFGHGGEFHCGSILNPVRVMLMEHDNAGAALARFRDLTGGYVAPADACGSYLALLEGLHAIEQDTHRHIHKENNILFERISAIAP